MNRFKNFIWDFDGTLFDTYPIYTKAIQEAITENTHKKPSLVEIEKIVRGSSIKKGLSYLANKFGDTEAHFRATYQPLVSQHLMESKPFSGVKETLMGITEHDCQNYLITHNDQIALDLLQTYRIKDYFSDFVLKSSGLKRKPEPESINFILKKHNLEKKETVYIGDRSLDIEAAHNANIIGIFFAPNKLIEVNEADIKIEKITDILNYLK